MRHKPGDVVDRYEVLESLGEGALRGGVQSAGPRRSRPSCSRVPNPQLFADPSLVQRYQREIEIARRLDHPGVQRSLDIGTTAPSRTSYSSTSTARTCVRCYASIEGRRISTVPMRWGRELADALRYLHSQEIVHRDLKPENVLVDRNDDLKISDFGTAMLEGARRLTWKHLSESLGTPDYMSPEQVQGERGDARSDVYAWGVMMYEILTGTVPFEGDNWLAVMAGHLQSTPRRIVQFRPEVPPGLEAVVLHAMRRYPSSRYQSADELVTDLGRLDSLDSSTYDLSSESPMGGMAAANSAKRLWIYMFLVAGGFLAAVFLLLLLEVIFR